jgi:hypothetical protein
MKKLFFFVLINIIYLTPAWADRWTYVAESKSGNLTVYVDKNTIRSSGKTVVWWQLDSYKNKLKGGNLTIYSTISKIEGDCIRDRQKDLYITYYDQKMGEGNMVLDDNPPGEWIYNEPSSVWYAALRYVCEKS